MPVSEQVKAAMITVAGNWSLAWANRLQDEARQTGNAQAGSFAKNLETNFVKAYNILNKIMSEK